MVFSGQKLWPESASLKQKFEIGTLNIVTVTYVRLHKLSKICQCDIDAMFYSKILFNI